MRIPQEKIKRVEKYIYDYYAEHGFSPSIREICKGAHIKSTGTAYDYVNRLIEQGVFTKEEGKSRTIKPISLSLTQDIVNVIRCKHCKHFIESQGKTKRIEKCNHFNHRVIANGYCNFGVPKSNV